MLSLPANTCLITRNMNMKIVPPPLLLLILLYLLLTLTGHGFVDALGRGDRLQASGKLKYNYKYYHLSLTHMLLSILLRSPTCHALLHATISHEHAKRSYNLTRTRYTILQSHTNTLNAPTISHMNTTSHDSDVIAQGHLSDYAPF